MKKYIIIGVALAFILAISGCTGKLTDPCRSNVTHKERIGNGTILEKEYTPPGLYYTIIRIGNGYMYVPNHIPEKYRLKINFNKETLDIEVTKHQFEKHNVNESVPIKYEVYDSGKLRSVVLI